MKALSVKQPHAERIARGEKRQEFRSWRVSYRGPLLIVASKAPDVDACEEYGIDPASVPHGVAICVVDLVHVEGDPGDYAWRLARPRRVRPVPLRGFAALYTVSDGLIVYV